MYESIVLLTGCEYME